MLHPPRIPILDNHFHLDPLGRGVEAVREFERSGGTHLILVHKPYWRPGRARRFNHTLEEFREDFETTLRLAKEAREKTRVVVFVALSPHPAEFTKMVESGMDVTEASTLYRQATDLAGEYVREGRAIALAEVGRPHWRPIDERILSQSNELMLYQFEKARDLGCAVQIHAESATPESYRDLRSWVDRAKLDPSRVVKHYSPPIVDPDLTFGLFPSVLVGGEAAQEAARGGLRFLMETDYVDEPLVEDRETKERMAGYVWRRIYPNKRFLEDCQVVGTTGEVLGPRTVPRRTRELLEKGTLDEEGIHVVHSENPRKIYGIEVEL